MRVGIDASRKFTFVLGVLMGGWTVLWLKRWRAGRRQMVLDFFRERASAGQG